LTFLFYRDVPLPGDGVGGGGLPYTWKKTGWGVLEVKNTVWAPLKMFSLKKVHSERFCSTF